MVRGKNLKNKDFKIAAEACIIESMSFGGGGGWGVEIWVLISSFFGTPLRSHNFQSSNYAGKLPNILLCEKTKIFTRQYISCDTFNCLFV